GAAEWNVGADAMVQRDDRTNQATDFAAREFLDELTLDQVETVRSTSAFGYVRIPLTERLRLTLGSRLDAVDFSLDDNFQSDGVDDSGERTFAAVSPGAGLAYDTGPALIFANYNTAFETPTTTELVNRPGQPGGFNPDLDPQRTRGFEVGTRGVWQAAQLQFDVALYQLWVQDRLVSFEIPDSGGRSYFQNVGENTHRGLELAVQWEAQPWLSLQTSYTANRIVFDGTDALNGNRVPGVPDQRFTAQATAQRGPVWMRLSWTAVDRYFADNANTARIDGYALTDIRVGLTDTTLGQTTVRPYVEVGNAFDASYIGSVSINANDNFYEPGVGRTVQAGVTVTL
ncbi:MAG: TonB-dependent receptor domain-containing protein, partial [Bacteroidota bacterium]